MAVYVTGDTHGYQERFFDQQGQLVPAVQKMTGADILIVAGDFGYLFTGGPKEVEFLDRLENLPFTIAFVDGNHENFPLIYSFPQEEWCGGQTHRIRRNLYHLIRGEIFDIQGCRIFVMGGAASVDKYIRQEGLSWWYQEIPTETEYANASRNLEEKGQNVQYIITHTAPTYIIHAMGMRPNYGSPDAELCGFLEWVAKNSPAKNYRQWYFGHWHLDKEELTDGQRKNLESQRFCPLNFDMVRLPCGWEKGNNEETEP